MAGGVGDEAVVRFILEAADDDEDGVGDGGAAADLSGVDEEETLVAVVVFRRWSVDVEEEERTAADVDPLLGAAAETRKTGVTAGATAAGTVPSSESRSLPVDS